MSAVIISGDTSGSVTLAAPTVAGTQSYTLPTAAPASSGYSLTSTTEGVMSWAAGAANGPILESYQTISSNYSITSGANAFSVGPVSVATGIAVSIPTGQNWLITA